MSRIISVGISEFRVASAPVVLMTYGLGSCVGIALYDPLMQTGALAHTLLPAPVRESDAIDRTAKFTCWAVELMVEALINSGCAAERLVAKLAGGATMFEPQQRTTHGGIGERNVASARAALERSGIPLVAEDTGDDYGRSLEFNTATGIIMVRALQKPIKQI
ncbi:putative chemoreceptor glutamine deamidase CheD 3 [Geotalea uraniireducens]|uniref:Probable chemoreceptor glutamine deamidase CheD n=1 Tax=Geotalea uraniireducens TaxID=351604 RepID=A0ABM8EG31_9BACT|nr:chemotaxis protein CheD [Geotalea uraniireducens]BDV41358.1 putative chemoreceptor glutamine deamidase CheD 3 [Geotalea uraniireducens]